MSVKIALLGAGTVGTQVARLLKENNDLLSARAGTELELIGISVRDIDAPRDPAIDRSLLTTDSDALIEKADIVIELIGGIEPPRTLVRKAIASGASVITGNKALLAEHGPEIYEAAAAADVDVYYEAAVAGAVPIVYGLRESITGDKVLAVQGILNGTTNFILDEMTNKGMSFDEALGLAQDLGFAEADPSADVDGHDAAAKIAILASLAFNTRVHISDVHTHGIRDVTADDIRAATDSGYVIKLVGTARMTDAGIELHVGPTLVPNEHPLASVRGSFNSVVVEAESAGRLMFYGRGAGGAPTASAVLSDLVAAAAKKVSGGRAPREFVFGNTPILDAEETMSRFMITLRVEDKIGTLAAITRVLADAGVSLSQFRQEPNPVGEASQLSEERGIVTTITTHLAKQADVSRTIEQLGNVDGVESVISVFRVEGN